METKTHQPDGSLGKTTLTQYLQKSIPLAYSYNFCPCLLRGKSSTVICNSSSQRLIWWPISCYTEHCSGDVENAAVENAGAITYGQPSGKIIADSIVW